MILYLDTSAKVKLYADEPGSALVRQAIEKAEIIACNIIAYAETRAALARKHRQGGIDEIALAEIKQAFENVVESMGPTSCCAWRSPMHGVCE